MGQYLPAVTKSLLSFFPDELNKLSCLCLMLSCFFSESFFIPFLWTPLTISTLLLNCKHQNWTRFLTVALPLLCNIKSSYLLDITLFYISGLHCPFSHRNTVRFHFEVFIQKESKIFFKVLVFQKESLPCTASCLHALLHCLSLTFFILFWPLHKLKQAKFKLDIRKVFFSVRVVMHWHKLPRGAVAAPSLEPLKARDGALPDPMEGSLPMAGELDLDHL